MKIFKTLIIVVYVLTSLKTNGQTKGYIGINTTTPKAALDIHSANSGIQLPRVSRFERLSMSPTHGAIVFDTSAGCLAYWNAYKNNNNGDWIFLCGKVASPSANCKDVYVTFNNTDPVTINASDVDNSSSPGELANSITNYALSQNTFNYCGINFNTQTVLTITNDIGLTDQCTANVYLSDGNTSGTSTSFIKALKLTSGNANDIEAKFQNTSALTQFKFSFTTAVTFTYNTTTTNNMAIWSQEASGTVANSNFMVLYIKNNNLKFKVGKIDNDINDYYEYTLNNLTPNEKYSIVVSYDGNGLTKGKESYIIRLLDFESQTIIANSTNTGTWKTVTNDEGPLKHGDIGGILKLGNSAGFGQLRGKIAAMAITSKYIDCNYELLNFATNPKLWINSQKGEIHPNLSGSSYTFNTNNAANQLLTAKSTQIWLMGEALSPCDFRQNSGVRNIINKDCNWDGNNANNGNNKGVETALIIHNNNTLTNF
jgi:hypothetical protein